MNVLVNAKYCPGCRTTKPISEFHNCANRPDGLQGYCKLCLNAKNNARNKQVPARNAERVARWHHNHPLESKISMTKTFHRARFDAPKDLAADAKITELLRTNAPCTYCGATTGLAIDHKVALAVGGTHAADQIQPICKSCNSRKRMQSDAEFRHQLQMEAQGYKRCMRCRQFKLRDAFYKTSTSYDGLCQECVVCRARYK